MHLGIRLLELCESLWLEKKQLQDVIPACKGGQKSFGCLPQLSLN